jgi:hypothetical protein
MSGTPPFAELILYSSGPGVEDLDDALFTYHTLYVFFGGAEVGEALAGVFLVFILFYSLALLIAFGLFSGYETWVPLGPPRPGSRPSLTSRSSLPEDPPTCQWAPTDLVDSPHDLLKTF